MVRAEAIGWRAHAALTASAGVAKVIAPLSRSFYAEAAGELIWIGDPETLLHPRAVLATDVIVPAAGANVYVTLDRAVSWQPFGARMTRDTAMSAHTLRGVLTTLGPPRGLARLLFDADRDDAVLMRARRHVREMVSAGARDDGAGFAEAARPLLGLGEGLTPSGDDLVGGALFACPLSGRTDPAWDAAIARVVAGARVRTHPISARLLADLAAGEAWAPLHDLASSLVCADMNTAHRSARELTTLGDSSGWSLLAGVVVGLSAG